MYSLLHLKHFTFINSWSALLDIENPTEIQQKKNVFFSKITHWDNYFFLSLAIVYRALQVKLYFDIVLLFLPQISAIKGKEAKLKLFNWKSFFLLHASLERTETWPLAEPVVLTVCIVIREELLDNFVRVIAINLRHFQQRYLNYKYILFF